MTKNNTHTLSYEYQNLSMMQNKHLQTHIQNPNAIQLLRQYDEISVKIWVVFSLRIKSLYPHIRNILINKTGKVSTS
jgi:hypothetical protein